MTDSKNERGLFRNKSPLWLGDAGGGLDPGHTGGVLGPGGRGSADQGLVLIQDVNTEYDISMLPLTGCLGHFFN